jgi:hypothetical protein
MKTIKPWSKTQTPTHIIYFCELKKLRKYIKHYRDRNDEEVRYIDNPNDVLESSISPTDFSQKVELSKKISSRHWLGKLINENYPNSKKHKVAWIYDEDVGEPSYRYVILE